jgi:DNA oxidative demethylase
MAEVMATSSATAAPRQRKADRIQQRQQQQPLSEHELDLFLSAPAVADGALAAAEAAFQNASNQHDVLSRFTPGSDLLPGMVLLKNFLSPVQQQQLVDESHAMGLAPGGFYKPTYASGAKCRLHQMCLGRHWNVVTEQYEQVRTNHDHAPVQPLPPSWRELAVQSLSAAAAIDQDVMGTCRSTVVPDICVVNYYKKAGRNGMHVDKDESAAAMAMGSPVISFSIGSAAEFAFCDHYPGAHEGVPVVKLESGDVLVFGGPSRRVVHALTRVYANTQPPWLHMRPGRLNLTFREY